MIAVIDYGVGNLFSLSASLKYLKIPHIVTNDPLEIEKATHLILPGVGAFGDASAILRNSGLAEIVVQQAQTKPLLGICLGMQLLFERGFEFGQHQGLGLIPGDVVPMVDHLSTDLKVPHMGWNRLDMTNPCPILEGVSQGDSVYFVHSYFAKTAPEFVVATAEYEIPVTAMVQKGNIFGAQFHPEKSGGVGLGILERFYQV